MTILKALDDPQLFAPAFPDRASWAAWEAFLAALFGLPMPEAHAALYRTHTGRQAGPCGPSREAWVVVGRRGGKSRVAALVAVYLACFRDYRRILARGEHGTLPIIAADRRQARTVLRYVLGLLEDCPMLAQLVANTTAESVELTTGVTIEVHTASFRSVRGYTVVAAVLDEVAFWRSDDSANPDREIVNALRPAMATVPGALLLGISSPYARRGVLWDAYRRHYGQDGDVLVWQAPTRAMNPAVPEAVIAGAYAEDEAAAGAEYGAQFRRDLEAFVAREALEGCIIPGRHELPPVAGVEYVAFVDPSGGSQDSMTLAIAHADGANEPRRIVLDAVREVRPPFSPDAVVGDFTALLRTYRVTTVQGDRYGGEWPAERFQAHGITYKPAEQTKSDLYRDLLPLVNAARVELLDLPRLHAQLLGLERRTARGGRDSIDHAPSAHDDLANAVAGACVTAADEREPGIITWYRQEAERLRAAHPGDARAERLRMVDELERRARTRGFGL
jgi:hypothetical protein